MMKVWQPMDFTVFRNLLPHVQHVVHIAVLRLFWKMLCVWWLSMC